MKVIDRQLFTKRVKVPAITSLLVITFYVAVFGNIYFSGQPVTLLVAGIPLAIVLAIVDTIKKGDI
jgi:hypothetical protein